MIHNKPCRDCGALIGARGNRAVRCALCAAHDPHRNAGRRSKLPLMLVGVDTETRWNDQEGRQGSLSLSFGREDGTGDSWIVERDGFTTSEAWLWAINRLSGPYTDAQGRVWRQAPIGFHLNHDASVLGNELDPSEMFLVRKAQAKIETALCGSSHRNGEKCQYEDVQYDSNGPSGALHRYGLDDINAVISDGMLCDVIAYHRRTHLAVATAPGQGIYAEHRPNGDRFEGWRRLVVRDVGRSFLGGLRQVINSWNPELEEAQRDLIEWGKQFRTDGFGDAPLEKIAAYSEAECIALARTTRKLITAVRTGAHVKIREDTIAGSGSIAAATLRHYGAPKRSQTHQDELVDPLAQLTYFGGLIEAPVVGRLTQEVDGADINSAYPSKMIGMPCQRVGHGRWVKTYRELPSELIGYAKVSWDIRKAGDTSCPPFMVRRKSGSVCQPLIGLNTWVPLAELRVALDRFGSDIAVSKIHYWVPECDCGNPLEFLSGLYEHRLSIKKAMTDLAPESDEYQELFSVEQAVKLIINSIYGKLAQSKNGLGPFTNLHYAAYITSATRAQMRKRAYETETAGGTVVYQHTDSVLSVNACVVDEGKALGKWGKEKTSKGLLIVQPGLAHSMEGGKTASRGVRVGDFIPAALDWYAQNDLTQHPSTWGPLTTTQQAMISRRQALARGRPLLAGSFETKITSSRVVSMKRNYDLAVPVPGNPEAWRIPPTDFVYDQAGLEDLREFKSRLDRRRQAGEFDD